MAKRGASLGAEEITVALPYRLRRFPGKGRGLEATVDLPKGMRLVSTPVLVIPGSQYPNVAETELARYVFAWGDHRETNDTALALGAASLFNHSANANCDYWPDLVRQTVVVQTSRAIKAGEELSIDYGWAEPGFKENTMHVANPLAEPLMAAMASVLGQETAGDSENENPKSKDKPESKPKEKGDRGKAKAKPEKKRDSDDNPSGDLKLRVLKDVKAQRLAQNVFKEFVGESRNAHIVAFMKAFDDLLVKFRGNKPLSEEEIKGIEEHEGEGESEEGD